ncbi:hypothetical protein HRR83_007354 [Exophiala dermatitidis]|nr:hypothetical protein HRR73_006809 [Exophiala dermatitidis]KAJ4534937.1 hypothetical protein HRR76_006838 [Exophiala dermatitidis]KAJ4575882.1 hypothetical protein HRR82_006175 [Exophiala dermatitidis]KAJ4591422.1 hypothetical protein HRR83_007354 [Exophiala dermatitidis]KAJ4601047.1 hypothetical protein HRR84_002929 [Exophiala dermatitidis]
MTWTVPQLPDWAKQHAFKRSLLIIAWLKRPATNAKETKHYTVKTARKRSQSATVIEGKRVRRPRYALRKLILGLLSPMPWAYTAQLRKHHVLGQADNANH